MRLLFNWTHPLVLNKVLCDHESIQTNKCRKVYNHYIMLIIIRQCVLMASQQQV